MQDACRSGEAQGAQKAQAREDFRQARPAYHSPGGDGQGEDQGRGQDTQRTRRWGGPVHGHGDRLDLPSSASSLLISRHLTSLCSAVSLVYCYVMYTCMLWNMCPVMCNWYDGKL